MHLDNGFYSSSKQRGFDDLDNHPNNTGHHWSNQMDKYAGNQNQSVASYPAIHDDPVTCLAPFKAGYCLSGSKDQVSENKKSECCLTPSRQLSNFSGISWRE